MVEEIFRAELEKLIKIPVFMEMKPNPPSTFVLLHKGGRTRENMVDTSRFVVESYGSSMYNAAKLNEKTIVAMEMLEDMDIVAGVSLITDYPAPDTENKHYRYQAIFDITHY